MGDISAVWNLIGLCAFAMLSFLLANYLGSIKDGFQSFRDSRHETNNYLNQINLRLTIAEKAIERLEEQLEELERRRESR